MRRLFEDDRSEPFPGARQWQDPLPGHGARHGVHAHVSLTDAARVSSASHDSVFSALQKHFQGRKYQRKRAKFVPAFDYAQYEPYLVPHRHNPKHQLYCTLTKCYVNRQPKEVLAHVEGRRYRAALAEEERLKAREVPEDLEEDLPEFLRDANGPEELDELEDEFRILAGEDDEDEEEDDEEEEGGLEEMDIEGEEEDGNLDDDVNVGGHDEEEEEQQQKLARPSKRLKSRRGKK